MNRRNLLTLGLILAVAGCAAPGAQNSPELAAKADAWAESFNAGDFEGVMALYAEGARLLPPNAPMMTESADIRGVFEGMAGLQASLETVEAMTAGDIGHRVGTYTLTAADGSVADRGKYVETWRKIDGEWKITNDAFSSDLPPAPHGQLAIGVHPVGDPEVWLAAWGGEERRAQFAEHGVASVHVFQSKADPAWTGLLLDLTDPAAFQAFLESDEGAAAAAADTVDLSKTVILEEVE